MKNKKMKFDYNYDLKKLVEFSKSYSLNSDHKSYHLTYSSFVDFYKTKSKLSVSDIIIGMSFTYSWMPTMLTIYANEDELRVLLPLFQKAKEHNQVLTSFEIDKLKEAMNHSVVGLSKLLHFINPNVYPIWDSRVHRHLFDHGAHKVNNSEVYSEFITFIHKLSLNKEIDTIVKNLKKVTSVEFTRIRALEFCMYGYKEEIKKVA